MNQSNSKNATIASSYSQFDFQGKKNLEARWPLSFKI